MDLERLKQKFEHLKAQNIFTNHKDADVGPKKPREILSHVLKINPFQPLMEPQCRKNM